MKDTASGLAGIRIIDMGVYLAGTGGSAMLGSLGAEVIKVEDPVNGDGGRGLTAHTGTHGYVKGRHLGFEVANINKKSITIDLKNPKGREILYKLVAKSDIFHTNYSKAVTVRLAVDYETFKKHNPKIIYCVTSGFGPKGPWAYRRCFDPLGQARSGLMWQMGDQDIDEPMGATGAIIDCSTATMAAFAMLGALVTRDRLGIGQEVHTSLLGSALHMQAFNVNLALLRGRPFARLARRRSPNPLTNHYKCGDGKWIMLAEMLSQRFWGEFCDALGISELKDDPRFSTALEGRREHHRELIEILEKVFLSKTRDEWVRIFEERDVGFAYSPIFDLVEAVNDPQAIESGYVEEFDHPVFGRARLSGFPVAYSQTPAHIRREAPGHGQHTEEVLREVLGYDRDQIAGLRAEGAI